MVLNLGRVYLLLIIATLPIWSGGVTAKLSRDVITRGDSVELIILVSGKDVQQPQLTKIGGYSIDGQAQENFFHNINGQIRRGFKLRYGFTPTKDTVIEPIDILVDGETIQTERLEVKVIEPTYNPDDPFTIRIVSDKSELYRGETVRIDVEYKESQALYVIDRKYTPPKSGDLWLKTNSEISQFQKGEYNFITISYFFTPQKSGDLEIASAIMRVAVQSNRRDSWGFIDRSASWKNVISNLLTLQVKEAPQKIVGDYEIRVAVDSDEVEAGKPVNLTLEVRGVGNIEDIIPFQIDVDGATVYEEKPTVEHLIENGEYAGYFKQKFAIIPSKSFTIDSFQLKYFNPDENSSYSIKSKPISVTVKGAVESSEELQVERKTENIDTPTVDRFSVDSYLLIGGSFTLGVLLTLLLLALKPFKRVQKFRLYSRLFRRDRELLRKILPLVGKREEAYTIAETVWRKSSGEKKLKIDREAVKRLLQS